MLETIKKLVAENLGISRSYSSSNAITNSKRSSESTPISSLNDAFSVIVSSSIPTEDLEKLNTVGEVAAYIQAHKE